MIIVRLQAFGQDQCFRFGIFSECEISQNWRCNSIILTEWSEGGGHGRLGAHQKLGPLLSILEPPMGIKSPCLDVSQDRATKRPAPRHTNAFYWTEKYMLEIREIHVHGVPHQMQHQIRPHNALSELDAAYIFLLCNSCHNRQRDCL